MNKSFGRELLEIYLRFFICLSGGLLLSSSLLLCVQPELYLLVIVTGTLLGMLPPMLVMTFFDQQGKLPKWLGGLTLEEQKYSEINANIKIPIEVLACKVSSLKNNDFKICKEIINAKDIEKICNFISELRKTR